MFYRLLTLGFGVVTTACTGSEQARAGSSEGQRTRYELVSIAGRALSSRSDALRTCNLRPYYGWLVISGASWERGDSSFAYCGGQNPDTNPRFTQVAGTLSIRLDTLDFFVADSSVGVRGLINRGVSRDDRVVVFGSDLDGGDYLFVQVKR